MKSGIRTGSYADDSAHATVLPRLREWFERLTEMGPDFGYYPNPADVSKDEGKAHLLYDELRVTVAKGSVSLVRDFIGDQEGI